MNLKLFLLFLFSVITSLQHLNAQDSTLIIKARLSVPFGKLVTLKIEIVDGEDLDEKATQSDFLFKIKSIDSVPVASPFIMPFKDETGKFPGDEFKLYRYLYKKKKGSLTEEESNKIKKEYVGKEFTIVAYETGSFVGVPNGYFEYQPVRQDYGFHFKRHLVVIADLTKPKQ